VAIAVRNASGRRRWSKLNEWLALVIIEKSSQARDVRAALGNRYGEIMAM
jgi:hypothetical protein